MFRAPKGEAYRGALANEARLLRYLQPRVDVGIPDYVYESADGTFAGYPLLAGRELDAATFGRLSDTERERIVEQLATFLTAVHETPKSTMADSLQGYPCTFEEGYAEFTERFELYRPQPHGRVTGGRSARNSSHISPSQSQLIQRQE